MEKSYLEKVKTELVVDPRLKRPITERTRRLRDELLAVKPKICPERGRLYTESWRETECQPIAIRRAKALEHILSEMTIYIGDGELIVGNQASEIRAAPLFPEFCVDFILDELDGKPYWFDARPGERFRVIPEDESAIREICQWWRKKTVADYKLALHTDEAYKASYEVSAFETVLFAEGGGSGHFVVDYPKAINQGFRGIVAEAKEELASLKMWEPGALEKRAFLESVIIGLTGVTKFIKRYAALADKIAAREEAERAAELRQIADICDWIAEKPARTFYEAIQLMWFVHLVIHIESSGHSISPGRFDQYMYPFYEKDTTEGKISPEEVVELLECLWIKMTSINKVRSWAATRVNMTYQMFQNLTVGGQTVEGKSAVNDLSWLVLEATANQKLIQPSVAVRWWNRCPDDFLLKCCEVTNIHRGGQPAFHNDELCIPAQLNVGVSVEDAFDYALDGCIEIAEGGKSRRQGVTAGYNMAKILEIALFNGKDPRTGLQLCPNPDNRDLSNFESFEEVMAAFRHQTIYYDRQMAVGLNCVLKAFGELAPTPFASSLMSDCIKKGKDIELGGAHYETTGPRTAGMANVGDSLAAIKKLVFEEKRLTGGQLKHALETNFEDTTTSPSGPEIQQMCLATPKYGNDDDYVDLLVREALEYSQIDLVENYTSWTGSKFGTSLMTAAQNVPFGNVCGALPDGRKAGVPLADATSPTGGRDKSGATAAAKSVAKLNLLLADNGQQFNIKFSPASFEDLRGLRKLAALIKTYFHLGGMEIQANIVSTETLKAAQRHPDKYIDLMVRVAGYSAQFVTLDPEVQEQIINRTEHTL